MSHRPCTRTPTLAASALVALLALAAAPAAWSQQATLTLSRDVALWSDVVEARIDGVGCGGEAAAPVVGYADSVGWVIDIDLQGCHGDGSAPFSTVVELGPLGAVEYLVRLQDAIRHSGLRDRITPPPQPFATAPLSVHKDATLAVELPTVPTAAAPFPLVLTGPARSGCFTHSGPQVHGSVIEWYFDDNCPFLPAGPPQAFRIEETVGPLPAGRYEVRAFDFTDFEFVPGRTLPFHRRLFTVYDAAHCVPSDTALCLQGARFRVEAQWEDFQGGSGTGHAIPLAEREDSGLLWFFSPANVEVTVKVLNGCPVNGHWWVFLSSGSTVHYTVTVTDTEAGETWGYENGRGESAPLIPDTTAFPCEAAT